jgi:hypothetical protein
LRQDNYTVETSASFLKFEFHSEGPRGKIKKLVLYKPFKNNPAVFNLGFGDEGNDGVINDIAISDNKDSEKILATVALTVYKFYEKHPECFVYVTGSTKARTRLYRRGLTRNLDEILQDLDLFGFTDGSWTPFQTGLDYEAFLIRKKK